MGGRTDVSRRRFIASACSATVGGVAGCSGPDESSSDSELLGQTGNDTGDDAGADDGTEEPGTERDPREIDIFGDVSFADPYAGVDWETFGRHKGEFHIHPHYADVGPPQDVYDRYVELGYDVINLQPKSALDRGMPWPLEEMGEMHDDWESRYPEEDGVVALPGAEYADPQHVTGIFTEVMLEEIRAAGIGGGMGSTESQYETIEYILSQKSVPDTVEPLVFLGHPGRYREGEFWDGPWDDEWISHYQRLLELDPMLGLEAITYGFGYDDRDLWDHLLERAAPDRPVIGTSVDDIAELEDADRGWVTFYLSEAEFSPEDQQATQEAVWNAFVSGRTTFSTTREPGMDAPAIEAIDRNDDDGAITIDASGHDVIEWVSNGDVIETGATVEHADNDDVGNYLRAQVVEGDPDDPTSITCTQAWHFDDG